MRIPFLKGAVEGRDGCFEFVMIFRVQVTGLARKASRGAGDLITRAEHLRMQSLKARTRGRVT